MARNEWTRWGRGGCEGYSLDIGEAYVRFHASVARSVRQQDGSYFWTAAINGGFHRQFGSREAAMAHVEFEVRTNGEQFCRDYAGYLAHRHLNRHSQAVDALRGDQSPDVAARDRET